MSDGKEDKKDFAIADVTTGELNALVKNIKWQTRESDARRAVQLINSGRWIIVRLPRTPYEKDGVVYFSVTSNGVTGQGWVDYFMEKRIVIDDDVKSLLLSEEFSPTSDTTYKIAILNGGLLECRGGQHFKDFLSEMKERRFTRPNLEVACLILAGYAFEEFGELRYHSGSIKMVIGNPNGYSNCLKLYGYSDGLRSMRMFNPPNPPMLWASLGTSFACVSQITKK